MFVDLKCLVHMIFIVNISSHQKIHFIRIISSSSHHLIQRRFSLQKMALDLTINKSTLKSPWTKNYSKLLFGIMVGDLLEYDRMLYRVNQNLLISYDSSIGRFFLAMIHIQIRQSFISRTPEATLLKELYEQIYILQSLLTVEFELTIHTI